MAEPIRPGFNPAPQTAPRPDAGRNAAQRAFFAAALGQAPAAAAAPQAQVQPQVQRVAAAPQPAAPQAGRIPTNLPPDPPTRILRPGSFLDIKV